MRQVIAWTAHGLSVGAAACMGPVVGGTRRGMTESDQHGAVGAGRSAGFATDAQLDLPTLTLYSDVLVPPPTPALPPMLRKAKGIFKAILWHVHCRAGSGQSAGPVRHALAQSVGSARVVLLKDQSGAVMSESGLLAVLVAEELQNPHRRRVSWQLLQSIVSSRPTAPELCETMQLVWMWMVRCAQPAE